ncbi:HAD family hydrolase [Streptomyces sp. NPDC015139]|uniref:HAD family hydrolase n=1 Tax=Streptomyces sp. NPDC015139 TaxID=3364942 RepID=UPI0036F74921
MRFLEPELPVIALFDLDDTLASTGILSKHRHNKVALDLEEVFRVEHLSAYSGMGDALTSLEQCMTLGIVTNSARWYAEQLLKNLFPYIAFDPIVTYDDVNHLKPDPESLSLAMRLANCRPEGAVFIGNSLCDHQAAGAAGVRFLGAGWSDDRSYPAVEGVEVDTPAALVHILGAS